jgi:16S rRNA (cytosine1402-N4)-methyltransferase
MDWLRPRPGGVYVDATLGPGGHAERILEIAGKGTRLVGIDWDEDAVRRARKRLARFGDAVEIVCDSFARLPAILDNRNIRGVDGILFDLGVSSLQLEDASRGFSFLHDGPLDMRMSRRAPRTAAQILRSFGERALEDLLREYGEERQARRIAKAIGRLRGKREPGRAAGGTPLRKGAARSPDPQSVLERTRALGEFVGRLKGRRGRIHPATRVFQALRIAVNDELGNLKKTLAVVDELLGNCGRVLIISFHSLEDRLVKRAFREREREGRLKVLTKKAVVPGREEAAENPRSRSAKLRVAERPA